jgi:N-acetylmuramoyl-L-alanine amidase
MAIYTVHGGHAKHGNKFCGAVGYCSESLVDRQIAAAFAKYMTAEGHTVYDCSVDSGISQGNIISKIKKLINSVKGATANVSIHLNAVSKSKADGKVKGCEVLIYSTNTPAEVYAIKVGLQLKALGFTNRGVKVRKNLGILKGITNGGANILVECFFCDDEDDYKLYNKLGADAIGKAIAEGVLGKAIQTPKKPLIAAARPTIKLGSIGTEAEILQNNLNQIVAANLVTDGVFGRKSVAALKKWQAAAGLTADGIYGPASYERMLELIGH